VYQDGFQDCQASTQKSECFRIEQLQARFGRLESENKPPVRMTDALGRQVVQVGRHAYTAWERPEPLVVGDQVWLAENDVSRMKHDRRRGDLTALGTDHTGQLSPSVEYA
jgi:hypothetical protein